MRFSVPHPIPYQGSKRRLASVILGYMDVDFRRRLIEPFAGSAAVTLAAAKQKNFSTYVLADALEPLANLWYKIVTGPSEVAEKYEILWHRERQKPIDEFYEIREEFNRDRDPAKLLYLLARCVKNSVRFNPKGAFNQSPDKRRKGTHPDTMRHELFAAHLVLKDKCIVHHADFMELVSTATSGDFFYLDPPYQGTSEGRDSRYISGVPREILINGIKMLNKKKVPFILSYDGFLGDRSYGEPLPDEIATRVLLNVGRSSQSTLNGRNDATIESLYLSPLLDAGENQKIHPLNELTSQQSLFI